MSKASRSTDRSQRIARMSVIATIGLIVSGGAIALLSGAGGGPPAAERSGRVLVGVEVVVREGGGELRGERIGLITNQTGVGQPDEGAGRGEPASTIDLLAGLDAVELVALFSPEHGIRGRAEAGAAVESGRDPETGLPIHSLYGDTREPTAAMLEGLEALVFDIQDIGTRYYTYVWTMALAMRSAAERGLRFVVLDRPNPIGGRLVQGTVLEPAHATFVGLYPVPMRHGMTAGELARYLNGVHDIGADLTVVPMEGWTRDRWYDDTGLPWVAPSPNMPSLESATHYPGTCLFEGTNLSVGRGSPIAFQQIGAPWLDHTELARRLNASELPGVRFEATTFVPENPGDGKYAATRVRGLRFITTDRTVYDPTVAAVAALVEIRRLHPDSLEWRAAHFDRLAGTDRLRRSIDAGADAEEITAAWSESLERFRRTRQPYLLYD